jgi:hypothetical protein
MPFPEWLEKVYGPEYERVHHMRMVDTVTCPECGAGIRSIEARVQMKARDPDSWEWVNADPYGPSPLYAGSPVSDFRCNQCGYGGPAEEFLEDL